MPWKNVETLLAAVLVACRWLMAPLYLGLIAVLMFVVIEFFRELVEAIAGFAAMGGSAVILTALRLIDLVLIGNLVLIMTVAGVDIFAAKTVATDPVDPRQAIGALDLTGLKLRILASIVAIAAVDLLESFINIASTDKTDVLWEVVILMAFVIAGLVLAWTDRLMTEH